MENNGSLNSSLSRMTIFGAIDSIERDLREFIRDNILNNIPISSALTEVELKNANKIYSDKNSDGSLDEADIILIDYIYFDDCINIISRNKKSINDGIFEKIKLDIQSAAKLGVIRNRTYHSRPLEAGDLVTALDIAKNLFNNNVYKWKNISEYLDVINSNPNYPFSLEFVPLEDNSGVFHNLPVPDFDDTAFLGRTQLRKEIKKILTGGHPVITIVGTGGYGKSALALRVAYDLLEDDDCPYEGICWVTAKSNYLSDKEIVRIGNALLTSVEVLSVAADTLMGQATDASKNILDVLNNFKTLLIIDNLETVLDKNIKSFVNDFIINNTNGSKILFTSRVKLGCGDFSKNVFEFTDKEAIDFFKVCRNIYGVQSALDIQDSEIQKYTNRLQKSPLFIKWFIRSVSGGMRAEAVLRDLDNPLIFCLENVFTNLAPTAKKVSACFSVISGRLGIPSVEYLTQETCARIEDSIQELLGAGILEQYYSREGGITTYQMSTIAKAYSSRILQISSRTKEEYRNRYKSIQGITDSEKRGWEEYSTSYYTLSPRNTNEALITRRLKSAISFIKSEKYNSALEIITEAKLSAPQFYEVHHVQALYYQALGEVYEAIDAYRQSIEEEPENWKLYLWMGDIFLKELNEYDDAIDCFENAKKYSNGNFMCSLRLIKSYLFNSNFDLAEVEIKNAQIFDGSCSEQSKSLLFKYEVELIHRKSEYLFAHGSIGDSFDCLNEMVDFLNNHSELDEVHWSVIGKLAGTLKSIHAGSSGDLTEKCEVLYNKIFKTKLSPTPPALKNSPTPLAEEKKVGVLISKKEAKAYGFIQLPGSARDVFVHKKSFAQNDQWADVKIGMNVRFDVEEVKKGLSARNVEMVD